MDSKKKFIIKIMAGFAVGIVSAIPAAEACTTTIVTKGGLR